MGTLGISILFAAGLALIFSEIITPGMILGFVGFGCIVVAIVLAFVREPSFGWVLTAIAIVFVPLFLFAFIRVLRKYVAIKKSEEGFSASEPGLDGFVGKEGITITTLRPAGMAEIDGRRVDVVADGEMIDENIRIEVTAVRGNRVVVRAKRG